MNPLAVRHVRDVLSRDFRDLIDLSDLDGRPEKAKQDAFYSRALAALAARHLAGCDNDQAAAFVIDGFDDGYIDAVAVDILNPHIWLIQAKWSDNGTAGLGVGEASKMRIGLDYLLNGEFDRFNARFQTLADKVDAAISDPNIQISLVVALAGSNALAVPVQDVFDKICRDLNNPQPMIDIAVLGLADFHRILRESADGPRIDLDVLLTSPGYHTEPYLAYQGIITVEQVHTWHGEHGDRLFERNIRKALGVTPVNKGMIDTLLQHPEHFLYYNNGITVLAETVKRNAKYGTNVGGPSDLRLTGVSVVNGAQTVTSISTAMRTDPTTAGRAMVRLWVVSLENCPDGFVTDVTTATNTQNQVEPRDFVALDETQLRLRDEFSLSLHKTYVIKRGDLDPTPVAGCSVVEAATALACLHPQRRDLVAHPKQNLDLLWDRGDRGDYRKIFDRSVNAYRVWRAVQLLRAVRDTLREMQQELEGKAAQITTHGDLVIMSIVARQFNLKPLDNADFDWHAQLVEVPGLTRTAATWLVHHIDEAYPVNYPLSLFKSGEKSAAIIDSVMEMMQAAPAAPELNAKYHATKPERRANAVTVIVEGGFVVDGTPLEFRPVTGPERRLMTPWLAQDPRRGQARWRNNRSRPLIWEADGQAYSPSGLVSHMLAKVTDSPPRAVQGTSRWFVRGEGSLVDIAAKARVDEPE